MKTILTYHHFNTIVIESFKMKQQNLILINFYKEYYCVFHADTFIEERFICANKGFIY